MACPDISLVFRPSVLHVLGGANVVQWVITRAEDVVDHIGCGTSDPFVYPVPHPIISGLDFGHSL